MGYNEQSLTQVVWLAPPELCHTASEGDLWSDWCSCTGPDTQHCPMSGALGANLVPKLAEALCRVPIPTPRASQLWKSKSLNWWQTQLTQSTQLTRQLTGLKRRQSKTAWNMAFGYVTYVTRSSTRVRSWTLKVGWDLGARCLSVWKKTHLSSFGQQRPWHNPPALRRFREMGQAKRRGLWSHVSLYMFIYVYICLYMNLYMFMWICLESFLLAVLHLSEHSSAFRTSRVNYSRKAPCIMKNSGRQKKRFAYRLWPRRLRSCATCGSRIRLEIGLCKMLAPLTLFLGFKCNFVKSILMESALTYSCSMPIYAIMRADFVWVLFSHIFSSIWHPAMLTGRTASADSTKHGCGRIMLSDQWALWALQSKYQHLTCGYLWAEFIICESS